MKQLDEILMIIQHSNNNDCSGIKVDLLLSESQFLEVTHFLQDQQLVEFDNGTIKITQKGKKFLELPT